jgi:hypothetical protein
VTGPLRVGDIVHGDAYGVFGRDHYACSRVEAIGSDWVVIRHLDDDAPCAATGEWVARDLVQARDKECSDMGACTCGCPRYRTGDW